jgi:hypothetical protein
MQKLLKEKFHTSNERTSYALAVMQAVLLNEKATEKALKKWTKF